MQERLDRKEAATRVADLAALVVGAQQLVVTTARLERSTEEEEFQWNSGAAKGYTDLIVGRAV
jgi:hypothetical protein